MASSRIRRNNNLGSLLSSMDQTASNLNARQNYITTELASQAVTNSSMPEELILSNRTIQTENYVEGATGWRISGDGGAEFSSVVVRGDINAYSGTIGYWNISTPAVSRVIGPHALLGTFIESSNLGGDDEDLLSGSYVGLYKSYSPEPVLIVLKERDTNVAILTSENHEFIVGDLVTISLDDDSSFNNGGVPVRITAATNNTFSYDNIGSNVILESTVGYAQLYNSDVAGLYLTDYSKKEFDYGYFSNSGVAYVSAEDINIIQNPSFEYKSSSNVITYSNVSWSVGSGLAFNQYDFTASSNIYYNASTKYGANITWTSNVSTYFSGTLDYSAGKSYTLYVNNKNLYLGFKVYPTFSTPNTTVTRVDGEKIYGNLTSATSNATTVTYTGTGLPFEAGEVISVTGFSDSRCNVINSLITSANSTSITVLSNGTSGVSATSSTANNAEVGLLKITSSSHGISANDVVFLDFDAWYYDSNFGEILNYYLPHTIADGTSGYTYKVLSYGLTSGIFYVPSDFSSVDVGQYTLNSNSGRNKNVYKVYETALDLSSIRIRYPNNNTTPIYNVLSDITKAEWDSGTNKYLISKANSYMLGKLDTTVKVPSMSQTNEIVISANKLSTAYSLSDNSNYVNAAAVYIDFPGWLNLHDGNGVVSSPTTKLNNSGYILDDLYVSTTNMFFYGNSGSLYRWVATTNDSISYDPAQASVEGTKQWLSIDLTTQSAFLDNFDYLKFRPASFTKSLKEKPSIGVYDDVNRYITLSEQTPEVTTLSGGQYEYSLDNSYYKNISSAYKTIVGERSSSFEISALSRNISISSGNESSRKGAFIGGVYDSLANQTKLYLSSDTFSWNSSTSYPTNEAFSSVLFNSSAASFYIPVRFYNNISVKGTLYSSSSILTSKGNIRTSEGDIYTFKGDIYTSNGTVTANTIRLTSQTDVSTISTAHAFQIGSSDSNNLRMDSNEIQAINNGSASTLYLNTSGANVSIGNTTSVVSASILRVTSNTGMTLTSTNHAFQVGNTGQVHLRIDTNDIQGVTAANNGNDIYINRLGGDVNIANTANSNIIIGNTTSSSVISLGVYNSSVSGRDVFVNSSGVIGYNSASSKRFKHQITPLNLDVEKILTIQPVIFKYNSGILHETENQDSIHVGFIAEDLDEAGLTNFVGYDENGVPESIQYSRYVIALQAVVRDQAQKINDLKNRVSLLEGK